MKILAVDYGDSRTGLATCDRTEFLTTAITPQITLKARNKVAARVCEVAKEIEEVGKDAPWYIQTLDMLFGFNGVEGQTVASSGE